MNFPAFLMVCMSFCATTAAAVDDSYGVTNINCIRSTFQVHGNDKLCRFHNDDQGPGITFNNGSFFNPQNMPEDKQIEFIHHQFAGVVGFESTHGSQSDFSISDQLSAHLNQ